MAAPMSVTDFFEAMNCANLNCHFYSIQHKNIFSRFIHFLQRRTQFQFLFDFLILRWQQRYLAREIRLLTES